MAPTSDTMGQRVRRAREAKNFKVNDLDRKIGTSPGYVSRLENDCFDAVGSDKLIRISAALDVSLDWLMCGDGPGPIDLDRDSAPPAA